MELSKVRTKFSAFNRFFHPEHYSEANEIYKTLNNRNSGYDIDDRYRHFRLEDYLSKKKDQIDSYSFNSDEINRMQAIMSRRYQENQSDEIMCLLCVKDFRNGERVLTHPICHHTFHFPCLSIWLKASGTCPLCKRGTRSGLMLEMENAASEQFHMIDL